MYKGRTSKMTWTSDLPVHTRQLNSTEVIQCVACYMIPHSWRLRVSCGKALHRPPLLAVWASKTKKCVQNKWIRKHRKECLIMKLLLIFKIINRSEINYSAIIQNRRFQFKWITAKLMMKFLASLYIPGIGYHFNSDESVSYVWLFVPRHNSKIRLWGWVSSVVLNRASKSLVP